MKKSRTRPHYPRLRDSVECRYCKSRFLTATLGILALTLLVALTTLIDPPGGRNGFQVGMVILVSILFLGYWVSLGYSWLEIFLHIDSCQFCEVVLDRPYIERSRYGARVRFTVEFADRSGNLLTRNTTAMFSSEKEPRLEDYDHKTVRIAYNPKTDRVIVIQRMDT